MYFDFWFISQSPLYLEMCFGIIYNPLHPLLPYPIPISPFPPILPYPPSTMIIFLPVPSFLLIKIPVGVSFKRNDWIPLNVASHDDCCHAFTSTSYLHACYYYIYLPRSWKRPPLMTMMVFIGSDTKEFNGR